MLFELVLTVVKIEKNPKVCSRNDIIGKLVRISQCDFYVEVLA